MWGHRQPHVGSEQLLGQGKNTVTHVLKNLRPYFNYTMQVMAATKVDNGTIATLHVTTKEAGQKS